MNNIDVNSQRLPMQFIWNANSRESYQEALHSESVQMLIISFLETPNHDFVDGHLDAVDKVNDIFLEAVKFSLRASKPKIEKTQKNNIKKWFDKECK